MMPTTSRVIRPVILSGGSGTRLWPMSRSDCPKQFLPLLSSATMLQATATRVSGRGFLPPYVVGNARHAGAIMSQLDQSGVPADALILEPVARNTAPAIALAAALAAEDNPGAILLVMPSDHLIADVDAFHRAIAQAAPVAAEGWLVTFGITPTAPETGYGYIESGEEIAPGVLRAQRFVEKPDRATAESYLDSGRFAWNGGIFLFRADAILDALGHRAPAIRDAALSSVAGARRQGPLISPDPVAFGASPSESIDYAVMEHWDRVAVVPAAMGWSDIGSWDALGDFVPSDEAGNCLNGDVAAIDSKGCIIRSSGPLVAAVGVSDLIVVATDDAVMIAPRGRSQDVKHLVTALKAKKHSTLDVSPRSETPWGQLRLISRTPDGTTLHEAVISPGASAMRLVEGDAQISVLSGQALVAGDNLAPGTWLDTASPIRNTGDTPLHLLIRTTRAGQAE